jgi:hypothetical protein
MLCKILSESMEINHKKEVVSSALFTYIYSIALEVFACCQKFHKTGATTLLLSKVYIIMCPL